MGDRKTLRHLRNQVRPPQVTQALLQKERHGIAASVAIGVVALCLGASLNGRIGLAAAGASLAVCVIVVWGMVEFGALQRFDFSKPAGWATLLFVEPFITFIGGIGAGLVVVWSGHRRDRSIYDLSRGAQWSLVGCSLVALVASNEFKTWRRNQISMSQPTAATQDLTINRRASGTTSVSELNASSSKASKLSEDEQFIEKLTTFLMKIFNPNLSPKVLPLEAKCRITANIFCEPLGWPRHTEISASDAVDVFLKGCGEMLLRNNPAQHAAYAKLARPQKMQMAMSLYEEAAKDFNINDLNAEANAR